MGVNAENLNWIKSIALEEFEFSKNKILAINVNNKKLFAYKQNSEIFVGSNKCPHAGASMLKAWIENGKIVCPLHRFAFDLKTGQCQSEGFALKMYPTKTENGFLYVGIKKRKWFWQ